MYCELAIFTNIVLWKLQHLLEAFKNDEISLSDIDAEVESVRKER